ncbi:MAG TPA: hypothetical protein PKV96_00495 [Candidatus Saccharimonas sp.]|jgi:hypothetical protein|nr:hypothetical protein [Candidatus Saccharimonas sp.]
MSLFKSRFHSEKTPLTPARSPATERVMRSIEYLGLDSAQAMLVGSGALCLYGIELDDFDPITDRRHPRPNDLDFACSPLYMNDLSQHGTTTGLMPVVKHTFSQRQTILTIAAPEMPADIITRFQPGRDQLMAYHDRFLAYFAKNSRPIAGIDMRIITPPALLRELRHNALDPKAAHDLSRARRHFGS